MAKTSAGTSPPRARVALLIDAENILRTTDGIPDEEQKLKTVEYAKKIFKTASDKGDIVFSRAYGIQKSRYFKAWATEEIKLIGIEAEGRKPAGKGKNAIDIVMVIDTLTLVHEKKVDVVYIVSNDQDFNPLIEHLKKLKIKVYVRRRSTPIKKALGVMIEACKQLQDEDGWAQVVKVAAYVQNASPAFSPENYGYTKFSLMIKAHSDKFEYNDEEPSIPKIRAKK